MKRAYCITLMILTSSLGTLIAQKPVEEVSNLLKMDATLSNLIAGAASSTVYLPRWKGVDLERIHIIVQLDNISAKEEIARLDGHINTDLGSYITVDLPISKVRDLVAIPGVSRVEYGSRLRPMNDRAKEHIGADQVHAGSAGLLSAYTGRGVVVGLIDDGIDVMHKDFRDPTDTTRSRIAYLWNQAVKSSHRPAGYSYGTEYIKEDIEVALSTGDAGLVQGENFDALFGLGHGTAVLGTAAGIRGIAPEATIVAVALENFSYANVVDAANYIIKKADAMQMPCVINCSWGTSFQPGDGSDGLSTMYNNLILQNDHVSICAAAGNSGPTGVYWAADLVNDTVYNGKMSVEYSLLQLYFDADEMDSLWLKIYIDSMHISETDPLSTYSYEKTVDTIGPLNFGDLSKASSYQHISNHTNGDEAGVTKIYSGSHKLLSGETTLYFYIYFDDLVDWTKFANEKSRSDFFRIEVSGRGSFYAYFDGLPDNLEAPEEHGFPQDHFLPTQNHYNVGPPAVAAEVLAVGAYTNRHYSVLTGGDTIFARDREGDIAFFSSAGPTLDDRLKPEITAPGYLMQTSLSRRFLNEIGAYWKVVAGLAPTVGSASNADLLANGTSFSSPVATGTIALMWQANPNLTFTQIRDIITGTASTDDFTEAMETTPNDHWGYGKLNALAAVREAERLLDVTATHDFETLDIQVYPNPVSSKLTVDLTDRNVMVRSIFLSDIYGRVVGYKHFKSHPVSIQYSIDALPAGTYLVTLISDRGKISGKILKI